MWQVKWGSHFAFLKRYSELSGITFVQEVGGRWGESCIEIWAFTFRSWVLPHRGKKERILRLPEDSVGWCSQEGLKALRRPQFSCTGHRGKVGSDTKEPHPSPNSSLTFSFFYPILCHLFHMLMQKAQSSLRMDQPLPAWQFISMAPQGVESTLPLKWRFKWWLGDAVLRGAFIHVNRTKYGLIRYFVGRIKVLTINF